MGPRRPSKGDADLRVVLCPACHARITPEHPGPSRRNTPLLAELRDDLRERYLRRAHRGVDEGLFRLPVDGGSGRVGGIQRTFQYQPPHDVLQRWEDDAQLAEVRVVGRLG